MRIRFICIHGHFYHPPRENPWLEAVETQDSASPYHDWNERVTAECYGPNASSRILDARDRIVKIVNNYASISFNFGPTLLSWLEQREPDVYAAILDADRASRDRFGGHGSALAQAYNHMILPLANERDKRTQVRWGAADFERRFGRRPEGRGRAGAAAFERLRARGENLAHRLLGAFSEGRQHPQLVNIATDGETYGHHHRHGDMALAYALDYIDSQKLARIANYGWFLAENPPTHEVEIVEDTSWSCIHGIDRWRMDCGCSTGAGNGWNQQWRAPLRDALDWLRDQCIDIFESHGARVMRDPWAARDDYIEVMLDRSEDNVQGFLAKHAVDAPVTVLELLEMQRNAMLMYTSCGWFFNDVSGIETVQGPHYA